MTGGEDRGQPRAKLASVRVRYGGAEYVRDLNKCRIALWSRLLDGSFREKNMRAFARSVGLSLATVSKWLSGVEAGRKDTTDRILAGLRVTFDDVHKQLELTDAPADDAVEESET
jgi:transcriptional regulator with XRE-family HTH domain